MLTKSNEEATEIGGRDQVNVVLSEIEHDEW